MTLQSSGAISMSDIRGEFGGSTPDTISEYYGAATGVPASGAISMSDFYGTAAGVTVTFDETTYSPSDFATDPANAIATLAVLTTGVITETGSANGEWTPDAKDSSNGADYDVRLSVISGFTPTGDVTGSWLPLTSNRSWTIAQASLGQRESTCSIEIRPTGGGSTIDSAGVNFTATVGEPV